MTNLFKLIATGLMHMNCANGKITAAVLVPVQPLQNRTAQITMSHVAALGGLGFAGDDYLAGLTAGSDTIYGGAPAVGSSPISIGAIDCGSSSYIDGVAYGRLGRIVDSVCFTCASRSSEGKPENCLELPCHSVGCSLT